ncbi:hypothetical protein C2G38_2120818 [Gigaspora rosea]|uniref:Uncharacterized protein n=1 Tax=Gigaspora rosea TaxID=44941 RepID=A0A397U2C0_9GLOM|nr:hypothetical protein C2G38_2120818 [Gigaspora rosea]
MHIHYSIIRQPLPIHTINSSMNLPPLCTIVFLIIQRHSSTPITSFLVLRSRH